MPLEHGIHGIPRRPWHLADDGALLAQQLVEQGGLADVRPSDDRHRGLLRLLRGSTVAVCREPGGDLVEEVADASAVFSRDFDHGIESQPVELERAAFRALVVGLVHGDHDRRRGAPERCRDLFVARQPGLRVHPLRKQGHRPPASALRPCCTTSSCSGSSLAPNIPPVSTSLNGVPCHSAGSEFTSLVVPAIGVTMARRVLVMRLKSVDLPTLGRPTSTTVGAPRGAFRGHVESLVRTRIDSVSVSIYSI